MKIETTNPAVIQTNGLSKNYDGISVLSDLNLNVPKYSIFGFLGPNGAGKTTTMKLLLGLIRSSSGQGSIFGYDIKADSLAIRARIGYLPQQPHFYPDMTARETVDFSARFFFKGPRAKIEARVNEMLHLVGLADKADRPVKSFSGGERQRLGMALFVFPNLTDPEGNRVIEDNPLVMGSEMFAGLAAVGLAIGVIVVMQDTLIEEKQLGTAAWVLSKPISRTAFMTAKLVANVVGLLLLMVLPTALAAYGLFQLYEPRAITFPNMAAMTAVTSLHALFYLTLALLMGTLTNSRGLLLAVTLGSLLGGGLVPVEALVRISPWQLQRVGVLLLHGQPIDTIGITMIGATAVWCIIFLVTAVWRFERSEF